MYLWGVNLFDSIWQRFRRRNREVSDGRGIVYCGGITRHNFSELIFVNIVEILTDLINDVSFLLRSGDVVLFGEFIAFVNTYGQRVLNELFFRGYVVAEHTSLGFRIMNDDEYSIRSDGHGHEVIKPKREDADYYVLKSETFTVFGKSDKDFLHAWLVYLDNVLNSSNTLTSRLGTMLIGSPKELPDSLVPVELTSDERQKIESELQKGYGSLREQNQILLLSRGLDFQTVNLSGLDIKLNEKVRLAILAIADRVRVPANQISIIDANTSKALSNGSELREGDFAKYQSFERLLNRTFVQMTRDLGMIVDYTIYNKPQRN